MRIEPSPERTRILLPPPFRSRYTDCEPTSPRAGVSPRTDTWPSLVRASSVAASPSGMRSEIRPSCVRRLQPSRTSEPGPAPATMRPSELRRSSPVKVPYTSIRPSPVPATSSPERPLPMIAPSEVRKRM